MPKKKYQGHLLVANPNNPKDELQKSVILIVTHTSDIAVGLQINNPMPDLELSTISNNIGLWMDGDDPVYYGGNINQNKIHVIHSLDWQGLSTVQLTDDLAITNDISVLAAISRNEGPEYFKACSGYWLWESGRLDLQLDPKTNLKHEPHKWEIAPATLENVFEVDVSNQWQRAITDSAKHKISEWF